MGRIYIRSTDSGHSELIDVSIPPVHISANSNHGTVSIRAALMDYESVVLRLPEGQEKDAPEAADFLADMLTFAGESSGGEGHTKIIEYAPENRGYWKVSSAGLNA